MITSIRNALATVFSDRLALGPDDHVLLARLRAIALLLRAAGAVAPQFKGIQIGLKTHVDGTPSLFENLSLTSCRLISQVAGWDDLVDGADQILDRQSGHVVYARTSQTEFLLGLSPALTQLLRRVRSNTPISAAVVADIQRAGWRLIPIRGCLRPILPDQVSAHETLEILAAAEEAGWLKDGPLAALARAAVRALAEGPRP